MILVDIKNIEQWDWLTKYCCNNSKFENVDFNILYTGNELDNFLVRFKDEFVCSLESRNNRMYYTGEYVRFRLSSDFRNFLSTLNLKNLTSFCLEDPSFNDGEKDYVSIINHENVAILEDNFHDLDEFHKIGFDLSRHFNGYYNT